ncbi:GNAT family N-acetyltransferase [Streptomyces sp. NPDC048483]|uniref:GNAT family N-acetyltransferase n=1 Tax=Streptomyces sp. NPDC048483 TaxID=3154927 RepID=UPI0034239256
MKTVDLELGDARPVTDLLPVLRQLRPRLTEDLFREVCEEGHGQGLRFTASYGDDGVCVGAAGWRMVSNTSALRKLSIDDLVTTQESRSTSVGRHLLSYLEGKARELGCRSLELDSGTRCTDAHRFSLRERMDITAFPFVKRLG